MRIFIYYSIILVFFFTNNCHMVISQNKFIYYQDFELAYDKKKDLKLLGNDFDLLFILLLDSTNKEQFFKYDPELKDLYTDYSFGLKLNKSTVGFVTQVTEIKEIFTSEVLKNKVFSCINDTITQQIAKPMINYPIYLKQNTAIVEMLTGGASDVYYFKLEKGIVQINWLGGTME